MKRIELIIHEPTINEVIGSELILLLADQATFIDAVNEVDKLIINRKGTFPVPVYRNLLHMIYNPVANRFYKQVAVTAQLTSKQMLNLRDDPKKELPEGTTVILIPSGGCIGEWEEPLGYEEFMKAISH